MHNEHNIIRDDHLQLVGAIHVAREARTHQVVRDLLVRDYGAYLAEYDQRYEANELSCQLELVILALSCGQIHFAKVECFRAAHGRATLV